MKRISMISLSLVLLAVLLLGFQSTASAATLKGSPTAKYTGLTPAQAAVTCSKNGCNGLDPIATGCSATVSTVLSTPIKSGSQTVGAVNLRFSSACGTNWAQVVSYIGNALFNVSVLRAGGADGPSQGYCAGVSDFCPQTGVVGSTYAYTYMVWAPDVAACAYGAMFDSNGNGIGIPVVATQSSSLCRA